MLPQPWKTAQVQPQGFTGSVAQLARRATTASAASDVNVRAQIRNRETLRQGIGIFERTDLRTLNPRLLWTPGEAVSSPFPKETAKTPPEAGALPGDICPKSRFYLIFSRPPESGQAQAKLANWGPPPGRNIVYLQRIARFGHQALTWTKRLLLELISRNSWGDMASVSRFQFVPLFESD